MTSLTALARSILGTVLGPDASALPNWLLILLTILAVWGTYALIYEMAGRMAQ